MCLFFKVFFTRKCIKIIFFLFFKNYFWYQDIKIIWKYQKNINLIKKIKKIIFLNTFKTQKQTSNFTFFFFLLSFFHSYTADFTFLLSRGWWESGSHLFGKFQHVVSHTRLEKNNLILFFSEITHKFTTFSIKTNAQLDITITISFSCSYSK